MYVQSAKRGNKSSIYNLPAPIKGLNRRDAVDNMDYACAISMDNYVPYEDKVVLRKGYVSYANLAGAVKTLATCTVGTQSELLAVSGHKIYNISSKNNIYEYPDVFLSEDTCHTVQYKNYLW